MTLLGEGFSFKDSISTSNYCIQTSVKSQNATYLNVGSESPREQLDPKFLFKICASGLSLLSLNASQQSQQIR